MAPLERACPLFCAVLRLLLLLIGAEVATFVTIEVATFVTTCVTLDVAVGGGPS